MRISPGAVALLSFLAPAFAESSTSNQNTGPNDDGSLSRPSSSNLIRRHEQDGHVVAVSRRPVRNTKRSIAPVDLPIVSRSRTHRRSDGALLGARSSTSDQSWAFTSPLTHQDGVYILDVAVGNPPQMYPLQLDLASADLVVASSACTANSCPRTPSDRSTLYQAGRSSSFGVVNGNETIFNLTFADGSYAAGFLATETLTLPVVSVDGNASTSRLHEQPFGIINATSIDLNAQGIVGIIGLGFPRLSQLVRAGLDAPLSNVTTTSGTGGGSSAISGSSSIHTSGSATTTTVLASSTPATSTSTSDAATSSSATSSDSGFSTITTGLTTSPTSGTRRRAVDSSPSSYFPPLLQNLFSASSVTANDNPYLAYPVIGLALANTSNPFSRGNDNASITIGGVSEQFVSAETLGSIQWNDVVPFAEAVLYATAAGDGAIESSSAAASSSSSSHLSDISTLEQEPYLYWAIEMHAVAVNGTPISLSPTYNSSYTGLPANTSIALLDVGTNGIWAPAADVEAIFSQIKDARLITENQYAVPCDSEVALSFQFGGGAPPIVLQPSDWIIGVLSGNPSLCAAWPMIAEPSADGIDWQLGTPFLRKTYSVYSYGFNGEQAPMVGFLPLPDEKSAASINVTATATSSAASVITGITSIQRATEISSLVTATINTNPPNVLLPDPTFTTPPYAFDTNSILTLGVAQSTGLANSSAYSVGPLPIVPTAANSSLAASASAARSMGSSGNSNAGSSSSGAMALLDFPPVSHLVLALIIAVVVGFFFS